MKIGDRIYVRGYVDEIGEDGVSVIVRNDGGYFETINSEIVEVDNNVKTANIRHGRWIYVDDDDLIYDTYYCSECRKEITVDAVRKCDIGFAIEDMKYCPHCGSRNREDE